MSFFLGLDVPKEKFDACGIGVKGEKLFTLTCSMDQEGFDELIVRLPKDKAIWIRNPKNNFFISYHSK